MRTRTVKLIIAVVLCGPGGSAYAIDDTAARAFAGRDVHISGEKLISFHGAGGEDVLVVEQRCSITAGADTFGGNKAVVWIKKTGGDRKSASVWAYVSGRVTAGRGRGTRVPGLTWETVEQGRAMVIRFEATGEVFVTVKSKESGDVRGGEFYGAAFAAVMEIDKGFADKCGSVSPVRLEPAEAKPVEPRREPAAAKEKPIVGGGQVSGLFGFIERVLRPLRKPEAKVPESRPQVKIRYPVNIAPAGDVEPNVEWGGAGKGEEVATIIGRFYLWQKQDEHGRLLEMQADAAVVFYSGKKPAGEKPGGVQDLGAAGRVEAVYARGDVIVTEGLRTIRADEMYYDFGDKRGVAINATLRSFDVGRGIPIYVRAARVRQLAENKFAAEDVVLTSSEFAVPQISARASSVLVTDTTAIDQEAGRIKDNSYDVQMRDVKLKAGEMTIFYWPFVRSNLDRPDVPFKSVRIGHDEIWGTSVESRWYLSRLLGLREPEGTDGTFELDYYSKRGVGSGVDVDYAQENRLGHIIGYVINDRGEDRLGRDESRRHLEPPRQLRGRFGWVHREFMPYNWQVTTGINYESDEYFVESYYRREFNTGEDRETYIHLKRIEDNWGLAFLGKGRINSFADELEESPTAEYHLTGQSIFDDKLTLYSDTQGGRFRQRTGKHHATAMNDEFFTFGSHRTELDAPVWFSGVKAVPYIAGTVGYDDRSGFNRLVVDGSDSDIFNEDVVGIVEAGLRASSEFWKTYPEVRSRLWDLDGLRHIIRPELVATVYGESDIIVKQHDVIHAQISQRLQTKRGPAGDERTVDWMRLDLGGTWFTDNDQRTEDSGPYRFIWNRPMMPLRMYTMPGILNGDLGAGLKKFETYGPVRDYFDADYMWQISDTTAFLGDAYYDAHSGTFEQIDAGFSRTRWPDLSYYIGSRYLRNVKVLDEHGSNAFVFAASYVLDPRYTLVFSQQLDFDYGANIESHITLIRRYHRVFWSLTFSADESLDRQAVMFSIWPEGVPELAIGSRRYTGLGQP